MLLLVISSVVPISNFSILTLCLKRGMVCQKNFLNGFVPPSALRLPCVPVLLRGPLSFVSPFTALQFCYLLLVTPYLIAWCGVGNRCVLQLFWLSFVLAPVFLVLNDLSPSLSGKRLLSMPRTSFLQKGGERWFPPPPSLSFPFPYCNGSVPWEWQNWLSHLFAQVFFFFFP